MVPITESELRAVAARLAGHEVEHVERAGDGGNSRLYRVTGAGRDYALKSYPPASGDPRDRLGVEAAALEFLAAGGIKDVPGIHALDRDLGFALMGWVEGTPVGNAADASDIDRALDFLARVDRLTNGRGAEALPAASEACISGREIMRQIAARLEKLQRACDREPELADFLVGSFAPAMTEFESHARAGYGQSGFDFAAPLRRDRQTLAPSDFGFHNIMRRPDGELVFIDFEYFGWDDPVKLTADFLLHPGTRLDAALKQRFTDGMRTVFSASLGFPIRLKLLYPLFGLRWVLILLNEFLPDRWAIRSFAGQNPDWAAVKNRQLEKAQAMLSDLQTTPMGGIHVR